MKKIIVNVIFVASLMACKNADENKGKEAVIDEKQNAEDTASNKEEWQYLFDGKNADGWRGYNDTNAQELPQGWVVEDETLKSLGKGGDIGGDIVYGEEEFGEFELYLEWKISPEGNSGIFYHVVEDEAYAAPYFVAPEYQIIDQKGFPHELKPKNSIGADYGMYASDYDEKDLRPVGEWNTTRIRFTEEKVTYWLNGQKTVEFEPWSEEWKQRKREGKWKDYPDYAKAKSGFIGLQDHGSFTWFRNIKIRKL
ncbi:DUF1080 domain-containing protein [Salegentibacter sp. BLCTC]|uniref:3-keto-disaccharide hydrolase n=1 Tax=Salegentibacter sp. BLCTC TaxID=2697368 RepID=UPI00187B815C|nr:DUF1080 domain-containing protein [Salegentibacter sp. BLCTC]MBE7639348.1 DUF1080 domain-containing protein [Salegentibacter sp. BLCTC]